MESLENVAFLEICSISIYIVQLFSLIVICMLHEQITNLISSVKHLHFPDNFFSEHVLAWNVEYSFKLMA